MFSPRSRDDWTVARTVPRRGLWLAQTPQGFRGDLLEQAYESARENAFRGTDDCQLVERIDKTVRLVPDRNDNIKITTPEDLALARLMARHENRHRLGHP